jgi:4-hydroxybenzoate polyprenyltransferase
MIHVKASVNQEKTRIVLAATGSSHVSLVDDRPVGHAFIKTMRLKHWAKNVLVFVPLLTAHRYGDPQALLDAALAFLCLGLCASGGYFINDLYDLEADRKHAVKKHRPLASGALSFQWGILGAISLPAAALTLSLLTLPAAFTAVLVIYFLITKIYSYRLKQIFPLDVLALSVVFMLRVLAGAAAIQVEISFWLLAFCIFLFVSLAYLKRYIEIGKVENASEKINGRGYIGADADAMFMLGIASSTASIVVLALFINSPEVQAEYPGRNLLWALCLIMLFWTNRIWIAARRGVVHEDPVEFALGDRASQISAVLCVAVVLMARYVALPF